MLKERKNLKLKKAAFIFLIFIIILSFSLRVCSLVKPINSTEPIDIMVKIENGMSGRGIANLLEKEGVIKSATAFYLLLRLQGVDNLKAGHYRFSTSNTLFEIIDKLEKGKEEKFKITIPEGFTLNEISSRFADLSLVKYKKEILEREIYQKISSLELLPNFEQNNLANQSLLAEGIIIPNTYHFPLSFNENDIASNLIKYFKEKRLPILKAGAKNRNYSAYQLLIIASLIEEEGKLKSENKLIASVIYNRLRAGMPLQLDATVQYVLEERTEKVLYKDLEIDSPYNTYQTNKLPPTPIASPGDLAVQAALKPAESDYLFYFALENGSHVFTKSYQEHLQKQRELLD